MFLIIWDIMEESADQNGYPFGDAASDCGGVAKNGHCGFQGTAASGAGAQDIAASGAGLPCQNPLVLDTFSGGVQVEWDDEAGVTPHGNLAFFAEFLKVSGVFDAFVEGCPIEYFSGNGPKIRNLLGTITLGILNGGRRYSHFTTLRGDNISAELLGMDKVQSEDSVRRGIAKIDKEKGEKWLHDNLDNTVLPALRAPWILDCDTTIKTIYGHQEGAEVGYNPHKKGRPSHAYHCFQISSARLILDVVVKPGNESRSKNSLPHVWDFLGRIPKEYWPYCIRGDKDWGNEANMSACEQENLKYLFKLRMTKNVLKSAEKWSDNKWEDAGKGWEGKEVNIRLVGWSRSRRIILLRKPIKDGVVLKKENEPELFIEGCGDIKLWEYSAIATSLEGDVLSIAQLYRDRADSENVFDELKNQWGWAGFTTQDLLRCQIMARMIALIYNWWSIFARLADPEHHHEALTTRDLLLRAVGRQVNHAGQKKLKITSSHSRRNIAKALLEKVSGFLKEVNKIAEQLTDAKIWAHILNEALKKFLRCSCALPPPTFASA